MDGGDRPGLRRPGKGGRERPQDHPRRGGCLTRPYRGRRYQDRFRCDLRLRPPGELQETGTAGRPGHRPDAGCHRPLLRAPRQPAGTRRQTGGQREHGQLRRAGDDSHGGRGKQGAGGGVRGDRGDGGVKVRRSRYPQEHRRIHPHHGQRPGAGRRRRAGQGHHHPEPG